MRRFTVTVNGVAYDVVVEENQAAPVAASAPEPAPAPAPAAATHLSLFEGKRRAEAPQPAVAGSAGAVTMKSPFPGTILKVNASVGDTVKKGDVLVVLEAMKMENDITAPKDGVIASMDVQQGATVVTDTLLLTMN